MNFSAFYFQGSHVGFVIGLAFILTVMIWALNSKLAILKSVKTRWKWLAGALVAVLWVTSFINVGHHRGNLPRHQYDTIQQVLTAPKLEAVKSETATRSSVMAEAEIKRKQHAQENQ